METRRLGRTRHESSIVSLGLAAVGSVSQSEADKLIDLALERGINQFDVAPSYGDAELRLSDYLHRRPLPDMYISCKTQQRGKTEAREQLLRTLDRLGRDQLDLYQLHAVCNMADLDACFADGGSMDAIVEAHEQGLVRDIGITGHGWEAPATHLAALDRYPFATVMTAANLFMVQNAEFRADWASLLERCRRDDIGIHLLKATAKVAWRDRPHTYSTWYEPFTAQDDVDRAVAWALHQPITTICSAGDTRLFSAICDAAEHYREVSEGEQMALLQAHDYGDIFVDA